MPNAQCQSVDHDRRHVAHELRPPGAQPPGNRGVSESCAIGQEGHQNPLQRAPGSRFGSFESSSLEAIGMVCQSYFVAMKCFLRVPPSRHVGLSRRSAGTAAPAPSLGIVGRRSEALVSGGGSGVLRDLTLGTSRRLRGPTHGAWRPPPDAPSTAASPSSQERGGCSQLKYQRRPCDVTRTRQRQRGLTKLQDYATSRVTENSAAQHPPRQHEGIWLL